MSHSRFRRTSGLYLDMHGLIFETSICYWQDQPGSLCAVQLQSRCAVPPATRRGRRAQQRQQQHRPAAAPAGLETHRRPRGIQPFGSPARREPARASENESRGSTSSPATSVWSPNESDSSTGQSFSPAPRKRDGLRRVVRYTPLSPSARAPNGARARG